MAIVFAGKLGHRRQVVGVAVKRRNPIQSDALQLRCGIVLASLCFDETFGQRWISRCALAQYRSSLRPIFRKGHGNEVRRRHSMSYIRQILENDVQGLLRKIYDAARARAGKVANIIQVMSLDPRSADSSIQFYLTLMKIPNALDASRREMLAAVVSNVNDCYY